MPQRQQRPPQKDHNDKYLLRLYVAGRSANSSLALRNLTRFCETRLRGRYELRVIDVLKEPYAAASDGVMATPTLIKHEPAPVVRMFGVLANESELATALGLDRSTGEPRPGFAPTASGSTLT